MIDRRKFLVGAGAAVAAAAFAKVAFAEEAVGQFVMVGQSNAWVPPAGLAHIRVVILPKMSAGHAKLSLYRDGLEVVNIISDRSMVKSPMVCEAIFETDGRSVFSFDESSNGHVIEVGFEIIGKVKSAA